MAREETAIVLMGHAQGTLGAVATQIEGFGEHGLVFIGDVNEHRAAELHEY
ncbi:hypothetical protein [Paraburkholderia strydomiana]|uniref:hypothetical protein n=1 Tax=Paraburkholderia strydomiana TaxID=1245417 RepID=UPI0038BBA9BD